MRAGARSAATMVVLCLLLVVGAAWGWSALTAPLPGKVDPPLCESLSVEKGEKVFPPQVVVSVFNAGNRPGLAGRTMGLFADRGFREGRSGNAPSRAKVHGVEVWAQDRKNPAVQLVLAQLRANGSFVRHQGLGKGVTVLVGDGFRGLGKKREFVRARQASQICSPPVQ